mmetsp:Transcript_78591/g.168418  ORF Transcript_78591/g.168418 Transcript_78591/m.168418 type:complete len:268 (+) Transcript_78591:150-953(+)
MCPQGEVVRVDVLHEHGVGGEVLPVVIGCLIGNQGLLLNLISRRRPMSADTVDHDGATKLVGAVAHLQVSCLLHGEIAEVLLLLAALPVVLLRRYPLRHESLGVLREEGSPVLRQEWAARRWAVQDENNAGLDLELLLNNLGDFDHDQGPCAVADEREARYLRLASRLVLLKGATQTLHRVRRKGCYVFRQILLVALAVTGPLEYDDLDPLGGEDNVVCPILGKAIARTVEDVEARLRFLWRSTPPQLVLPALRQHVESRHPLGPLH